MKIKVTYKEMLEMFKQLEEAGLNPQWCNVPVPYFDSPVQAGAFTDPGDITPEGYVWLPEEMVKSNMTCILPVRGESMRDAGFSPGDRIVVEYGTSIVDGDTVVASVGSESTLKSYMKDDEGRVWLVPQNPDFDAILLEEDMMPCRMGKVTQLIKTDPRVGYRDIFKVIERTRKKQREAQMPSREEVTEAVKSVAPHIMISRLWYAVYRVLVDRRVLRENAFDTCVRWLEEDVPEHPYLPEASDLQRLASFSFSKPVKYWNADNAPVTGKRFRDYCRIAQLMEEAL
jgi:SOS-response transcriptional repressor LexA